MLSYFSHFIILIFAAYAVDALEIMMKDYKGTIIFVTHDKTLINGVADIIYEIKDRKINRIKG